jgi:DNA replication protein DnaC
MIADHTDLDALFKRLHLANARRVWRDLVERAEREAWAYRDFLTLLATEEIAHRQQTRLARLTRRAHFPFLKTIDDFNFTFQSSLRLHMLGSALAPDFVTEGRSLILAGKPGRGKTHLAIAIAYRAIQNGFDAFFTTAAALIDDLSAAFRAGELANALPTYTHPVVLVVDEVGYLTYGTDAANMLFHVVNERHRRHRPMIFTTNKSLKQWGRVLHDEDLAQAIIDRVLERGRLLRLDGPSVRTLHVNLDEAMKEDSDQGADLIRISGKSRPEFPEPTPRHRHVAALVDTTRGRVFLARIAAPSPSPDGRSPTRCDRNTGGSDFPSNACLSRPTNAHFEPSWATSPETRKAAIPKELRPFISIYWSGREDLNLRPLGPEPSALPG